MAEKFKSETEIQNLAQRLKERRQELGLTLEQLAKQSEVHAGQLSRIERGGFKSFSNNLQKLCNFLQIKRELSANAPQGLGPRLERIATLSPRHQAAAEDLVNALERLS